MDREQFLEQLAAPAGGKENFFFITLHFQNVSTDLITGYVSRLTLGRIMLEP